MNKQITITVKLFGEWREYSQDAEVSLKLPINADVATLKQTFIKSLNQELISDNSTALLNSSVFANESEVLSSAAQFTQDQMLTIWPPVCGG
jgi:hypothetical protein